MHNLIRSKNNYFFRPEKEFKKLLKQVLGYTPKNYRLYQQALIHKSASRRFSKERDIHNERLEFLGDAILDSVIAEHLYKNYPGKDEGFLTQLRSKIVNRETLRRVAVKMGIGELIIASISKDNHKGLFGDTLEAIIGAIYLDKGYRKVRKFILKRIINYHLNVSKLSETEMDFKSRIIEWGQKSKKDINFTCQEQLNGNENSPVFISHLLVFDDIVGMGIGKSKKEAEQNAAKQAIQMIGL